MNAANVTLSNCFTDDATSTHDVDNIILVTSKPPLEALFHTLVDRGQEVQLIRRSRDLRWSVFVTDEAIKGGRWVGLAL
jgi:hypothetical protein